MQLKKHLLSDPTSKSRDKFMSIVESLVDHSALPRSSSDLRDTFRVVIQKVVYGFTTAVPRPLSRTSSPSCDAHSEISADSYGSPTHSVPSAPLSHDNQSTTSQTKMEVSNDIGSCASATADSARPATLPNVRYVTRSSTIDGFRTGTTTVNGTTYRCRYMVEQRVPRPPQPRGAASDASGSGSASNSSSSASTTSTSIVGDTTATSGPKPADYLFDPTVFDDQAHVENTGIDTQPWEFLDDLTWEHPISHAPLSAAHCRVTTVRFPLLTRRPSQPLPLQGASHPNEHRRANTSCKLKEASVAARSVSRSDELDYTSGRAYGSWLFNDAVPFPDYAEPSIFSRRTAFTQQQVRSLHVHDKNHYSAQSHPQVLQSSDRSFLAQESGVGPSLSGLQATFDSVNLQAQRHIQMQMHRQQPAEAAVPVDEQDHDEQHPRDTVWPPQAESNSMMQLCIAVPAVHHHRQLDEEEGMVEEPLVEEEVEVEVEVEEENEEEKEEGEKEQLGEKMMQVASSHATQASAASKMKRPRGVTEGENDYELDSACGGTKSTRIV